MLRDIRHSSKSFERDQLIEYHTGYLPIQEFLGCPVVSYAVP